MSNDYSQSDVPSLDEDLVAYLDGELDDPASRRLEERLSSDEAARQRLRALATSWDLLDYLPRAAVDDDFTRTTVQMVALAAADDIANEQAALPARKRRRWIAGAIAALAAAMVGFVAIVVAWPDPNQPLLRDLPVVKNFELYDVMPSIEFLRQLDEQGIFVANVSEASHDEPKAEASDSETTPRDELAARRKEIEAMPSEKKEELRKLYERFKERPEPEKERLRVLDAALRADPEEARLRGVLERYHNWLPTLSPLERAELRKLATSDTDAAIAQIQKKKQQETRSLAARVANVQLTQTDMDAIESWLQERVWRDKEKILEKATPEQRRWFEEQPDDRQKRALVRLAMRVSMGPPKLPDEQEVQSLLNKLSEPLKAAAANAPDPESRQRLLFSWHGAALRARDAIGGGVSREELERFFNEELSEEKRKELSGYSTEEFHRRLRREYFFKKELPPGEPWKNWGGRGRGGRRGPDDGPPGPFGDRRGGPPSGFDRQRGAPSDEGGRRGFGPPRDPAGESSSETDRSDTGDHSSRSDKSD